MQNLEIREFEQAIINFTNQSELPPEAKRLVFTDILNQITREADYQVKSELAKREEERKKKDKEDKEDDNMGEAVQRNCVEEQTKCDKPT